MKRRRRRFKVVSVTGWNIGEASSRPNYNRPAVVTWYVLDSAYGYAIVAEFAPGIMGIPRGYDQDVIGKRGRYESPESFARRYAAALEEAHR